MLEPSEPNYEEKDSQKNYVTKESAECKAKYRINCSHCRRENCINCSASPYHDGFTCEEYLQSQQTVKCRYCGKDVLDATEGEHLKRHITCNEQVCQDLNAMSCQKVLPCGHLCNGASKSKEHIPCLHPECVEMMPELTNNINNEEGCLICMEELKSRPCVILK
jgi:E3 ubiquitin-protein ligase MYCBP2